MTADKRLGLTSILLLALIQRDPERAYGKALIDGVGVLLDRKQAGPQVYIALRRLREDGYIRFGKEIDETTGPPLKLYKLTAKGKEPLTMLKSLLK